MKITTDAEFRIGKQHLRQGKPCQDYALAGAIRDDLHYAIVSDGCSSGQMTDVGARLMALATRRALTEYAKKIGATVSESDIRVVNQLRDMYIEAYRIALDLKRDDLLATCLWALATPDIVAVHVAGDGAVVTEFESDSLLHSFEWEKSSPYYPIYRIYEQDKQFLAHYVDSTTAFTHEQVSLRSMGMNGEVSGSRTEYSAAEGINGVSLLLTTEGGDSIGRLKTISLLSDGVSQVDSVTEIAAATELTKFRTYPGQFVTRRMKAFVQKVERDGSGPLDDLSMAAIHLANTEKEKTDESDQTTDESRT